MNADSKFIESLRLWPSWLRRSVGLSSPPHEEAPLRAELYSTDQLAHHGTVLAAAHQTAHQTSAARAPDQLLARLAANEVALVGVCKQLAEVVTSNRRITPAGEWLLDNFYLIEEQIRTAKRHLPKGYSRELPRLAQGPSAARPRVYDIALEIVAHGDGRVDTEGLSRFVAAYQSVTPLKLGELWAIPIMLRLAVIENLRRVGVRIAAGWAERNLADTWADRMIEVAAHDPKSLILTIADMAHSSPPMVGSFVAEFARRLQGRGPALALPLTWIEQQLSESGRTIEQLVQWENQQQAADQVSISNSIGSLRVLGAMDWRSFVETLSVVEQTLRDDPGGVYGRMDFASRDQYRHATEALAKTGRLSEGEVAHKAVELAHAATLAATFATASAAASDAASAAISQATRYEALEAPAPENRAGHVGFYLVGEGLPMLEAAAQVRRSGIAALCRWVGGGAVCLYLGIIALISLTATASLLFLADSAAVSSASLLLLGLLGLLATSQLAVALVNWLATLLVAPKALPRMDFSQGIPPQSRTLVIVPTMLGSAAGVEELIEALEVRFLANRDACLHFGLLTDFLDAPQETVPEDAALLRLAHLRVVELNQKYAGAEEPLDRFFLFHRPRCWNSQEGVWMGYERKRGKLAALNALLRAEGSSGIYPGFSLVVGDTTLLTQVRYVITLDTDTQLPRDAARQLVGAMAHPLNRPHYDAVQGRVTQGYGILQPRVAVSLPASNRSHYARLYSGEPGIDPYTRAISDVYQDLFGEGSFIGKGIYDVDAFTQALAGRFPENRILSHDLLEGCYARAGLLSDVDVYEDSPARYSADVSRRHRWMRGDWQLSGWLLRRVLCPHPDGPAGVERQRNPLSVLSQWKLFDNLRRTLVPSALTLLLLLGWCLVSSPGLWTLAVLGILLIPAACALFHDFCCKPGEVLLPQHLWATARAAGRCGLRWGFELASLPYEAFFSLDALLRTLWRTLVTHRRLLEWRTSSEVERAAAQRQQHELAANGRAMWVAPALALITTIYLAASRPAALLVAGPILLLWMASPVIAWWVSRPLARRKAAISITQTLFLRSLARRTWAFFERVVGSQDHWLPPDNHQEYRAAAVAHRTSPTNIGLGMLANLSAYDFGYIPAGQFIERTANTFRTLHLLERHRGHFYNWYDTESLQPLSPRYISTVDSGNLAGSLLTLRPGLLALADEKILQTRLFQGLGDTLRILVDTANGLAAQTAGFQHELAETRTSPPATLAAARRVLVRLASHAAGLVGQVVIRRNAGNEVPLGGGEDERAQACVWAEALDRQCHEALVDLGFLAPWLLLPAAPTGLEAFAQITDITAVEGIPTLREVAALDVEWCPHIARRLDGIATAAQRDWLAELRRHICTGSSRARERLACIEQLALQSTALAQMEYGFLYDPTRHLLSIGYNVAECRVDSGYYDLLASEARLSVFVAIAQGQLPQESWFALGRLLTGTGGEPVLLSWSGSMFEYLMPMLVMPSYDHTLLAQTCKAAVARQIEYGKQRGVPWGISESGYNTVDGQLNYQYRAFGVPGLGLKRGLSEDLVIAPYASALALMVAPEAACQNLQRLAADGFLGPFGFFEAIDYTPSRQRRGQTSVVVRSFMAHHQGMSLLALAYLLLDRPMQRRFESDRLFQAVMLLLQERIPKASGLFSHTAQRFDVHASALTTDAPIRVFHSADTPIPQVQLLSNGRYHVMVSHAGGGYSRWKQLAVTRWREDATCDHWGNFCYIREVAGGAFWSSAHQPTLKYGAHFEAIFSEGRAEFRRRDAVGSGEGEFETHTEIVVSPEDDIELRRVRITNRSREQRQIEVTSYAEVVLAPAAADELHPTFSNLFVQTEILREQRAILCTRRPRSLGEAAPWMLHLMAVHGADCGEPSYETDRARFIGRGRNAVAPLALSDRGPLSGTEGSVLDPIVAIRHVITLGPEQSATIDMVTGITDTREQALSLIEKYHDRHLADRVFDLNWTHSQVVLRQLNATEADAQLHARLASSVIYADAALRADPALLIRNRRGQSGLWGYAISGDLPIVLLQIAHAEHIDLVRQLVQAHAYWRLKGLAVDLVIWNEDHNGYRQQLQEQVLGLIASGIEASVMDKPGGIFVRTVAQISSEDRLLFQTVARAIISDSRGTLAEQLDSRSLLASRTPRFTASRAQRPEVPASAPPRRDLILFNGLGGFTPDGREYVITLAHGQTTPAPWANVLANPHFGTVISESGGAYTWCDNAHEFRLTPWHNDPVSDACGEALYLRDEETGQVWSPTPLPMRAATPYVIRHGFGYSVFETRVAGIASELWVYVATDAAVKFSVLKLRNESGRPRKLSVTGYVEWVLGDLPAKSAMHISTDIATHSGALYARNPYSPEFAERVAFFDVDEPKRSVSGDRREFLGRNGNLRNPAALRRIGLSGKVGAGLDPCGVIQVNVDLADGQAREVVFRLGVGRDTEDASRLVQRFRGPLAARTALESVWQHWNHTLGAIQVETPDPTVNVLTNGWLVYQTLACRVWARSGYYQSGGAFGYRDQLQDVMALVHAKPALVREHLLLCGSRQFQEGDVQHWWHPPAGRGVRTRCSDDYLWLPLAVCRYVQCTADTGVLDEQLPFLEGRPVNPDDDAYYDLPGRSVEVDSLYQHCVRAIRHGLRFGEHGLPLIGSGDWNDGMNLVGIHGRGESVWLGFFLYEVLRQFSPLARAHGDDVFADQCWTEGERLRLSIEQHAWDGAWYRRAWFDDGTPLGSAANAECQIDSISQSWSVLSGAGEPGRQRAAMHAVDQRLVRRADALVQLLDPPFNTSSLDPGYIRGYVPGVRENGGQYTHGAIWAAMAFAALNDPERAWGVLNLINPLNHALTPQAVATYKVEPYVVAADVYGVAPHTGRGGWSWYTGSAGWMYRLIVESLLGLRLVGDKLHFTPCLPADWPGFKLHYRYRETVYHLVVTQLAAGAGAADAGISVAVDGVLQDTPVVGLVDDRREHEVVVTVRVKG